MRARQPSTVAISKASRSLSAVRSGRGASWSRSPRRRAALPPHGVRLVADERVLVAISKAPRSPSAGRSRSTLASPCSRRDLQGAAQPFRRRERRATQNYREHRSRSPRRRAALPPSAPNQRCAIVATGVAISKAPRSPSAAVATARRHCVIVAISKAPRSPSAARRAVLLELRPSGVAISKAPRSPSALGAIDEQWARSMVSRSPRRRAALPPLPSQLFSFQMLLSYGASGAGGSFFQRLLLSRSDRVSFLGTGTSLSRAGALPSVDPRCSRSRFRQAFAS